MEIIVVCNACTDGTAHRARALGCRVLVTRHPGVSHARNLGARTSRGDVLCFLDADTCVSPGLLELVYASIGKGFIGGYTRTLAQGSSRKAALMWFIGNLGRNFFPAASGFLFCRADRFHSFPQNCDVAEDTFFLLRLESQGRLCYIRNAFVATSMRRQERDGYLRYIWQTYSGFFFPRKQRFGMVR